MCIYIDLPLYIYIPKINIYWYLYIYMYIPTCIYNQIYTVLESTILTSHDLTSKKKTEILQGMFFVQRIPLSFHGFSGWWSMHGGYIKNSGGKHADTSSILTFSFDFPWMPHKPWKGVFWHFRLSSSSKILMIAKNSRGPWPTKACLIRGP